MVAIGVAGLRWRLGVGVLNWGNGGVELLGGVGGAVIAELEDEAVVSVHAFEGCRMSLEVHACCSMGKWAKLLVIGE